MDAQAGGLKADQRRRGFPVGGGPSNRAAQSTNGAGGMFDFTGQKILVVGGGSGIGFATAQIAVDLGAEVTIASRSRTGVPPCRNW